MSQEYLVDLGVDTNPLIPDTNSGKLEFNDDDKEVKPANDELKMNQDLTNKAKQGKT